MEWNKVMNFGDPSTFGTEMADRFVASGANLPPPVSNRVNVLATPLIDHISFHYFLHKCLGWHEMSVEWISLALPHRPHPSLISVVSY